MNPLRRSYEARVLVVPLGPGSAHLVEERLALPWMHPGRADVIAAGGLILGRILRRSRVETLLVSEADILDGIAWSVRD